MGGCFPRVGSYARIYGVFGRRMGYVTIFATQVVTPVARDCFSRSVVRRENFWRPGVADKKPQKNRVSCLASGLLGLHG